MSMGVGAFERYYPTPLHPIPPHTLQKLKTASLRVRFSVLKCLNMLIVGCFFDVIPLPCFPAVYCCILCKARGIISNMLRSYGAQDDSVQTFGICRRSRDEICMNIDTKKDADPEVWQNVLLIDIIWSPVDCVLHSSHFQDSYKDVLRISRKQAKEFSGLKVFEAESQNSSESVIPLDPHLRLETCWESQHSSTYSVGSHDSQARMFRCINLQFWGD